MGVVNEALRDKAPDVPSFAGPAQQDYQSQLQSAIMNMQLNRPNEMGPFGSRTWNQTGTTNVGGMEVPNYTASTQLHPILQRNIFNSLEQGGNQAGKPLDFSGASPLYGEKDLRQNRDAVTDALYRRQTSMLDPRFAKQEDQERTRLANQGFQVGNKGFDDAIADFSRNKEAAYQDAADRAIVAGGAEQSRLFDLGMKDRTQDISEILAQRSIPLQELQQLAQTTGAFIPNYQGFAANANIGPSQMLDAQKAAFDAELGIYDQETKRTKASTDAANSFSNMAWKGGVK